MINFQTFQLKLKDPFGIARSTRTVTDVVLVRVDGGWGESSPTKFYNEDVGTVTEALERMMQVPLDDPDLLEDASETLHAAVPGNASARAAVDIALHDRFAARLGVPLYRLFGRAPRQRMVSSFTIGIAEPAEMLRKVEAAKDFEILKIKLGRDVAHDVKVMKEIRRAAGDSRTIRVDANAGYSLDDARRALPVFADLGVEFVEQPLAKGNIEELRELKKGAPLPIYVDEDSMVAADIPRLAGAVDGINIKLMKSGGLVEARRMVALARSLDLRIMLGCMIETSVAITAAAHLAPHVDCIDLDGNLLVTNDPFTGVECLPGGELRLPESPGLGVAVRPEARSEITLLST